MILFHGTTTNRLFSIMQKGLLPKKEKNSNIWVKNKRTPAVCLTPKKKIAKIYANRKMNSESKGFPVVLTLKLKKQNLIKTISDSQYSFASFSPINKNSILKIDYYKENKKLLNFFFKND